MKSWPQCVKSFPPCSHFNCGLLLDCRFVIWTIQWRYCGHLPYLRHWSRGKMVAIFLKECVWIAIKISLWFVPRGPINNISALVHIMTWRQSGDKPLSEPTHICVTRPQCVKYILFYVNNIYIYVCVCVFAGFYKSGWRCLIISFHFLKIVIWSRAFVYA